MERLVIASHNAKKSGEMVQILSGYFPALVIQTLADFPGAPEPEETGATYAENATIKVESAFASTGLPCLADDAGLEIDFFNGEPGIYSKRFLGEETTFPEKMRIILERMQGVPEPKRGARFRCCIAFAQPDQPVQVFEAICEGQIATSISGNGGFGYDPIFWLPEKNCTMADLTAMEKHEISHRGKVLRQFGEFVSGH